MHSPLFRFAALALLLHLAACGGSDDKTTDTIVPPDVTQDVPADLSDTTPTPDVDTVSPDVPVDTFVPDTTKPDTSDTTIPTQCEPACVAADGQYCDAATATCKTIQCDSCVRDIDCGETGICLDYPQTGGASLSFCSVACVATADCPGGFECTDSVCLPVAICPAQVCQSEGELGDACPFEGLHSDCAACAGGTVCAADSLDVECQFDSDCYDAGISAYYNPVCNNGLCGYSYCTGKCDDQGKCPEGFGPMLSGFSCWCVPVGSTPAGEACPFDTVNPKADDCGAGMVCLGIAPSVESTPCTTDAECVDAYFDVAAQCVGGFCGLSFCSPKCTKGLCEDGFAPISVSGDCYCAPVFTGDAQPGEICSSGNVYPDADKCAAGSTCISMEGEAGIDTCTTVADCPLSVWYANAQCLNGLCNSAFCSPYCDVDGKCPAGYDPTPNDVSCLCLPEEVGDAELGEGCALWVINSELDFCQADLACLAFTNLEEAPECTTAADCDASTFVGTRDCVDGKCSASFCSGKCDEAGKCPLGFNPIAVGDAEECYCAPKNVGTSTVGQACMAGPINNEAPGCTAELGCLSMMASTESPAACTLAADCPDTFVGVKDCVEGLCASSFCAAECDAGACPEGMVPADTDPCYCQPAPPALCADTCTGCCDGETCIDILNDLQCGLPGAVCAPCVSPAVCTSGVCV